MSYTSSKLDKNENDIYPLNAINMYNYADTFKEEKDRASLSNVFNQNLGRSGVNHDLKNELYIQQEDNRLGEIENSNIIEDINDHEEKADYSSSLKQEYEDEIKQADNVEIYEDNNDHIEEFNEEANGERREDNEN